MLRCLLQGARDMRCCCHDIITLLPLSPLLPLLLIIAIIYDTPCCYMPAAFATLLLFMLITLSIYAFAAMRSCLRCLLITPFRYAFDAFSLPAAIELILMPHPPCATRVTLRHYFRHALRCRQPRHACRRVVATRRQRHYATALLLPLDIADAALLADERAADAIRYAMPCHFAARESPPTYNTSGCFIRHVMLPH